MLQAFRHQPEVFALRMQPDLAVVDYVEAFGAVVCITLWAQVAPHSQEGGQIPLHPLHSLFFNDLY